MAEKKNQCDKHKPCFKTTLKYPFLNPETLSRWLFLSNMEDIKLFGKWSFEGIQVEDPGLKQYISLKPVYVPHSMGRHEHGKFHKAKVNIVERLINNLMRPGSSAGKKTRAINLVKNALEIIHIRTGENPIQVLITAVENT